MLSSAILKPLTCGSYISLARSMSWLVMPWPLASPGHNQPRYWLCRDVGRRLTWRLPTTCVMSTWSDDLKCKYMFLFPLKNLAHIGFLYKKTYATIDHLFTEGEEISWQDIINYWISGMLVYKRSCRSNSLLVNGQYCCQNACQIS